MMSENSAPMKKGMDCSLSGLYQALMAHAIHQDSLLWGRIAVLIAIQGAVLLAGYKLRSHWLGIAIMGLGALLTFCIYLLTLMDNYDKKINYKLMDEIARDIISDDLAQRAGLPHEKDLYVRLTSPEPKWRRCFPAIFILRGVILLFITIDITLGILYLLDIILPT